MALAGLLVLAACGTEPQFKFRYTCLDRSLDPCLASEEFIKRAHERTNGQVQIEVASYAELELDTSKAMEQMKDGTLVLAEMDRGTT